jgi:hypothetical protein
MDFQYGGLAINPGYSWPARRSGVSRSIGKLRITAVLTVTFLLFGSSNTNSEVNGAAWEIYDETCTLRSAYQQPDCGIPWQIEENFLTDVLTITSVSTDVSIILSYPLVHRMFKIFQQVGEPYFQFLYGNGKYSINNNHCGCQSKSSGLTAVKNCKCAFPVDGIFTGKRSAKFSA